MKSTGVTYTGCEVVGLADHWTVRRLRTETRSNENVVSAGKSVSLSWANATSMLMVARTEVAPHGP